MTQRLDPPRPTTPRPTFPTSPTPRITSQSPFGDPRGMRRVMGTGGLATSGDRSLGYGGQFAVPVSDRVEVTLAGGQFADVMPAAMRAEAERTAEVLSVIAQQPVTVNARVPALYTMGGVRVSLWSEGMFRPYVEGGAGLARLQPRVSFMRDGSNITRAIAGGTFQEDGSSVLMSVTGGVLFPIGPFAVDFGYRYMKSAKDDAFAFETKRIVFGLGARF